MLANCRSHFLLDRLGRCLKLLVSNDSTSCHEFASQFGLDILFFLYAKNTQNYREYRVVHATVYLNEALPAIQRWRKVGVNFVMVGRTDPSNSDNQNGDGGGLVCAYARVCVCACVRACVRDVFAIYDKNILPRLIMIIKIIFLYFIEIAHALMISPQRVPG